MTLCSLGERMADSGLRLEKEMLELRDAAGEPTYFTYLVSLVGRGMQAIGVKLIHGEGETNTELSEEEIL